jgi:hypothetical protein
MFGERGVDAPERRARPGAHHARVGFDGDGIHAAEVDDDSRPEDNRSAHQPAPAAARHERHTRPGRPADERRHVTDARRLRHRQRTCAQRGQLRPSARGPERVDARGVRGGPNLPEHQRGTGRV